MTSDTDEAINREKLAAMRATMGAHFSQLGTAAKRFADTLKEASQTAERFKQQMDEIDARRAAHGLPQNLDAPAAKRGQP